MIKCNGTMMPCFATFCASSLVHFCFCYFYDLIRKYCSFIVAYVCLSVCLTVCSLVTCNLHIAQFSFITIFVQFTTSHFMLMPSPYPYLHLHRARQRFFQPFSIATLAAFYSLAKPLLINFICVVTTFFTFSKSSVISSLFFYYLGFPFVGPNDKRAFAVASVFDGDTA